VYFQLDMDVKFLYIYVKKDGRVSPKHVVLKVHNKYSIALSW